jgi:hypothetical protein
MAEVIHTRRRGSHSVDTWRQIARAFAAGQLDADPQLAPAAIARRMCDQYEVTVASYEEARRIALVMAECVIQRRRRR